MILGPNLRGVVVKRHFSHEKYNSMSFTGREMFTVYNLLYIVYTIIVRTRTFEDLSGLIGVLVPTSLFYVVIFQVAI